MTEIGEFCKSSVCDASGLVHNKDIAQDVLRTSKEELCDPRQEGFGSTDNFLDMVTKLFMEAKNGNFNVLPGYQTEPLDLSQKQHFSSASSLPKRLWKPKSYQFDKFFSTYIKRYTANDVCNSRCKMLYKDHYHCFAENGICTEVMKGKDQLRQHGKRHSIAEELTKVEFSFCVGCPGQEDKSHYHCCHENCDYISTHISNMDRLVHVETNHCVIISKRTNNNHNQQPTTKHYSSVKRRKKMVHHQDDDPSVKRESALTHLCTPLSPMSDVSSDNQFVDFNTDSIISTVNQSNCLSILDRLYPDRNKRTTTEGGLNGEELEESLVTNIKDHEKNFFESGNCGRIFCNLKKGDHYHCPICDRGSSKKDLYLRHLKQRHK